MISEQLKTVQVIEDEFNRLSEPCTVLAGTGGNTTATVVNWRDAIFDYRADIAEPEPLISISGTMALSRGNLGVITGLSKACKTTLMSVFVSSSVSGERCMNINSPGPLRTLLIDTEQSPYHLGRTCNRVLRLAQDINDENFVVLRLREFPPEIRRAITYASITEYSPDIVFIDGVADLIADSNDLAQSEALVSELLAKTSQLNCGIFTIIHTNPGTDSKLRGHLGSSIERKAETVIHLDKKDVITVSPRMTRNKPFDKFSFYLRDDGDPALCSDDAPLSGREWLLKMMEPGRKYQHYELVKMLQEKGLTKSGATSAIKDTLQQGFVSKENTWYTLKERSVGEKQLNKPNQPMLNI